MVVIDIWYQMVEKNRKDVNGVWRAFHLGAQLLGGFTSLLCTWYFQIILYGFHKNCPLSARIEFSLLTSSSIGFNVLPKNVTINLRESTWGNDVQCQLCFSTWMVSFLASLILISFFVWSQKGRRGEVLDLFAQPWRAVYPALLVSVVIMIMVAIVANVSSNGLDDFCLEFEPYIETRRCNNLINKFTLPFCEKVFEVYQAIIIIRICAPLCVGAWIFQSFMLLCRICLAPDFTLQLIKVVNVNQAGTSREMISFADRRPYPFVQFDSVIHMAPEEENESLEFDLFRTSQTSVSPDKTAQRLLRTVSTSVSRLLSRTQEVPKSTEPNPDSPTSTEPIPNLISAQPTDSRDTESLKHIKEKSTQHPDNDPPDPTR